MFSLHLNLEENMYLKEARNPLTQFGLPVHLQRQAMTDILCPPRLKWGRYKTHQKKEVSVGATLGRKLTESQQILL